MNTRMSHILNWKYCILLFAVTLLTCIAVGMVAAPRADAATCGPSTNFITTWKTDNTGTSTATSIRIPTTGSGYNYSVDWNNDGIMDQTGITGAITHDFGVAGTYTIQLCGNFPRIYFNNAGDRNKILAVNQWGNNGWTSMNSAFNGCNELDVPAPDAPNLNNVTDARYMFWRGYSLVGTPAFNTWNVSKVQIFLSMFRGANQFNQPLGNWDTSSATNMETMFENAKLFNQPISNWNTGNVTNMRYMFNYAEAFNQYIGDWDVRKVTSTFSMFFHAIAFNQPLTNWQTDSLTGASSMFGWAYQFNQPLDHFNMSKVTTASAMFEGAQRFNQPLNSWDISQITVLPRMFYSAYEFNQPLDNWDVSNATNMREMFTRAYAFNQDISMWDVSDVTNMSFMFSSLIVSGDVKPAITVSTKPDYAMAFNQDISVWDMSSVTTMVAMFGSDPASLIPYYEALGYTDITITDDNTTRHAFNQSLAAWNMTTTTNVTGMLARTSLSIPNYDATLIAWSQQTLQPNLVLGATSLDYCTSRTARQYIIDTYGWTILGDTYDCLPDIPVTPNTPNAPNTPITPITPIGAPDTGSGHPMTLVGVIGVLSLASSVVLAMLAWSIVKTSREEKR